MFARCVLLGCLLLPQLSTREPVATVWTGRELIVWGDRNRSEDDRDGAASNPFTGLTRPLPPAPLALNEATAIWSGEEMIVFGADLDRNNRSRSGDYAQGMAYDPAGNTWRLLPRLPLRSLECYPESVRAGRVILAWYCGRGALFDIDTGSWRRLPLLPAR